MICFKDTKAFINERLSEFPVMFPQVGLKLAKESFPHQLMNRRTYDKPLHLADIAESYLEQRLRVLSKDADEYLVREAELAAKEDYDTLVANARAIGAIIVDGTQFDTVKYAIHYCRKDVEVLATCFEAFRKMMLDKFNQDVYYLVSLPSLAYNYLNNRGCYNGCYAMSGAVLAFVREAVVGGRCMTRDNQKHHFVSRTYEEAEEVKTNVILDSDVNSLYPAAMARLKGFAKGKPKFFQISEKEKQIPPCDYYIARVQITGLNKKRAFPLQSTKDENGVRQFTNDLVGKKLIIDKTALEDLVEFQSVSYKVIECVYWDEGFNSKICEVMPELYNERMKLKAQGNPLQQCVKLLMNASFGKKIQKPIVTQKRFIVGADEIKKYTKKNICKLLSRTTVSENVSLFEEVKPTSQHFSPAHLGVQLLSMSKRIMNKVMCLAEDIGAIIYYQDTDSCHIESRYYEKLKEEYFKRYGRVMDGKDLGQFSSDFKLDGAKGQVYAIEAFFVGKKTYLDVLESEDGVCGMHKRCKGVPSSCVQEPYLQYSKMYHGVGQSFNLTTACPLSINNRTQRVSNRPEFIRELYFP